MDNICFISADLIRQNLSRCQQFFDVIIHPYLKNSNEKDKSIKKNMKISNLYDFKKEA